MSPTAKLESSAVLLERLSRDLRQALRGLSRARLFTAVAVLSLALGLGSAAAIFSLVDGVLLKPLPYRDPDRIVFLREVVPALGNLYPSLPANLKHFRLWQREARSVSGLAAFDSGRVTLAGGGAPEVLDTAEVTADLFRVLGVELQAGRPFTPAEEGPGRARVAIVTDHLWRQRFGASPHLLGSAILLDGTPHTVVGILSPSFRFPHRDDLGPLARMGERTEIFRPLAREEEGWGGDYDYSVFARLKPGVSASQARAELDLLEGRIAREHDAGAGLRVSLRPLPEVMGALVRTGLYALLAAVGLLVLLVGVNLANLLLARGSVRAGEVAVRIALGAPTASLVRQVLLETLLLSLTGGLLGVLAATAALRAFVAAAPVDLPRLAEVRVDFRVWLFTLGLALLCGLLSGLPPALRALRLDPQETLRAGGPTLTENRRALGLREILVGCEVGVSAALLLLAGLLVTSLVRLQAVDRGFRAERALAVDLRLPRALYPEAKDRAAFFDRALASLRELPGVRSAAFVSKLPLQGESEVNEVQLEGGSDAALDPTSRQPILLNVRFVSPGYFATLGIPLRRGRGVEEGDRLRGDLGVTVVSARLAAKLWPGRDPLGRRFSTGSRVGKVQVVGVVEDVHNARLEDGPTLIAYVPFWKQGPSSGSLVLRTAQEPAGVLQEVRKRVWAIDPGISVPPPRTLAAIVSESLAARRFEMQLATGFALFALLLAGLGIYGVVAYSVAQRRREIGVRMALGARAADILRLVLARGFRPVLLGLAGGVALGLLGGRLVRSLLYGVSAADPATLGGVVLVLAWIAALACLLPALDAARTDPAGVLRRE